MKFWRKKALLAKVETTYGTDAAPSGAENAILAANVQLTPIEGGEVNRETIQEFKGARGDIPIDEHVALQFDVEVAGGGAADTPPGYGPLLRGCGMAETITAGTSVEYDPVSEDEESVTIALNIDGVLHKMLGARGSVALSLARGAVPRLTFRFLGLLVDASDDALPTTDTSAFQTPLVPSTANTPTLTIDGFAAVTEELSVDLNNTVEGRFLIGGEAIILPDREANGSALIEMPSIATKDFFAIARAKTRVALALEHGTAAGNIFRIDAPAVEIGRPGYEERQGVVMQRLPFAKIVPVAGDDEIKFTTK